PAGAARGRRPGPRGWGLAARAPRRALARWAQARALAGAAGPAGRLLTAGWPAWSERPRRPAARPTGAGRPRQAPGPAGRAGPAAGEAGGGGDAAAAGAAGAGPAGAAAGGGGLDGLVGGAGPAA